MRCYAPGCVGTIASPVAPSEGTTAWLTRRNRKDALALYGIFTRAAERRQRHGKTRLERRFGKRLVAHMLEDYPCFLSTLKGRPLARQLVHEAERELREPVSTKNLNEVFETQLSIANRRRGGGRQRGAAVAGAVSELIIREVLLAAGLVESQVLSDKAFITLGRGRAQGLQNYGDFLIPSLPFNLLISVKTVAARERLIASASGADSVGVGFFGRADEFNPSRTRMYQRSGFVGIYLPPNVLLKVAQRFDGPPLNNNGTPFYRPNTELGKDMFRIAGRSILEF